MDIPPDPVAEAWKGLGLAFGGGLVYLILDLLVLRHNGSFQKGRTTFRIGLGALWIGVCIGAMAWFYFARANSVGTAWTLRASYVVRAIGVVILLAGLLRMMRKN